MTTPALEVRLLTKFFGPFCAVDHISFSVPKGHVVGLLGPNGAGKTTTIHMLLGITNPTSGTILYFGRDSASYRQQSLQRMNYASAYSMLQGRITVWENLLVFAGLYRIADAQKKINRLVDQFEMRDHLDERVWSLSSGERTRVSLIKALLNDPELILMDEPTASLDPDIADKTISLIEELRAKRKISILYTSHNMDEVTRLCDTVVILNHGNIIEEDSPETLAKRISDVQLRITVNGSTSAIEALLTSRALPWKKIAHSTISVLTTERELSTLIVSAHNTSEIVDIDILKPTLEDVFLTIARRTTL